MLFDDLQKMVLTPKQVICMYQVDELISIQLLRPSYSRAGAESAITILTYSKFLLLKYFFKYYFKDF